MVSVPGALGEEGVEGVGQEGLSDDLHQVGLEAGGMGALTHRHHADLVAGVTQPKLPRHTQQ